MGELQDRIQKEFQTASKLQYSPLRPRNQSEVAGMLETGMLPNINKIIEMMKKDFPWSTKPLPNDYELTTPQGLGWMASDIDIWKWFEKWLCK